MWDIWYKKKNLKKTSHWCFKQKGKKREFFLLRAQTNKTKVRE